jgi:hypothetical protein
LLLSPFGRGPRPLFEKKMNFLYSRMIRTKFWLKFANWFRGRFFFNIKTCKYGPSRTSKTMIWINLNLHYIRKLLCEFEIFLLKILNNPTPFFAIISPLRRTCPFICTILNFLYPRKICTKLNWIWSVVSGEDLKKKFKVFLLFCYYLPLGRGVDIRLNNFEFPLPKDNLC